MCLQSPTICHLLLPRIFNAQSNLLAAFYFACFTVTLNCHYSFSCAGPRQNGVSSTRFMVNYLWILSRIPATFNGSFTHQIIDSL